MKYFSLGQQKVLFVLALFLLLIIYFRFYHQSPSSIPEENVREFVVEVVGEVHDPGVYIFQNPATLKEAIEKAGGFKEPTQFDKGSSSETIETGTLLTITKESPDKIKGKIGKDGSSKIACLLYPPRPQSSHNGRSLPDPWNWRIFSSGNCGSSGKKKRIPIRRRT